MRDRRDSKGPQREVIVPRYPAGTDAVPGDPRRPHDVPDGGYKLLAATMVIDAIRKLGRYEARTFLRSELCELICDVLNVDYAGVQDAVRNYKDRKAIQAKVREGLKKEGVDR